MEPNHFSFWSPIPKPLTYTHYCPSCFDENVAPKLAQYNAILEKAKQLYIFFDTQKRPHCLMHYSRKPVSVKNCTDRDETILRIGFLAAEQGYNAAVDVSIVSKKMRHHAWEKLSWQGDAVPAQVDERKLQRESFNQ